MTGDSFERHCSCCRASLRSSASPVRNQLLIRSHHTSLFCKYTRYTSYYYKCILATVVYFEVHSRSRLARHEFRSVAFLFFVGDGGGHFQEAPFGAAAVVAAAVSSEKSGNRGPRPIFFASHMYRAYTIIAPSPTCLVLFMFFGYEHVRLCGWINCPEFFGDEFGELHGLTGQVWVALYPGYPTYFDALG